MKTMKATALALRLAALLGTSALFTAAPVKVQFEGASALPALSFAAALADDGGNGGEGGGGEGHDGHDGGSDDHGSDDHDGGDDHGSDDSGSDDSGDDSSDDGSSAGGDGGGVLKVERSASGMEVTYADGTREEIENGRYERKNSAGRTVEERPATQADMDRLSALF